MKDVRTGHGRPGAGFPNSSKMFYRTRGVFGKPFPGSSGYGTHRDFAPEPARVAVNRDAFGFARDAILITAGSGGP
jgi:hypothetical protein